MDIFPTEIWTHIIAFLEGNHDKFHLLASCQGIIKCDVLFDQTVDIDKIVGSQWFDKFVSIRKNRSFLGGDPHFDKFPMDVREIEVVTHFHTLNNIERNNHAMQQVDLIISMIPSTISHLTFGLKNHDPYVHSCTWHSKKIFKNIIPSSLISISFWIENDNYRIKSYHPKQNNYGLGFSQDLLYERLSI